MRKLSYIADEICRLTPDLRARATANITLAARELERWYQTVFQLWTNTSKYHPISSTRPHHTHTHTHQLQPLWTLDGTVPLDANTGVSILCGAWVCKISEFMSFKKPAFSLQCFIKKRPRPFLNINKVLPSCLNQFICNNQWHTIRLAMHHTPFQYKKTRPKH